MSASAERAAKPPPAQRGRVPDFFIVGHAKDGTTATWDAPLRREGREMPRFAFWPRTLMYSERVRYAEQLRRFHAAFPREQVLVLIYDDFRADNEGTVREVLRFLGVDETYPVAITDLNPTR